MSEAEHQRTDNTRSAKKIIAMWIRDLKTTKRVFTIHCDINNYKCSFLNKSLYSGFLTFKARFFCQ